jgi:hypothetical protein
MLFGWKRYKCPQIIVEEKKKRRKRQKKKHKKDVRHNAEKATEYRKLTVVQMRKKENMEKVLTVSIFSII